MKTANWLAMAPPGVGDNERNAPFSIGQTADSVGRPLAGLPQCAEIGEIGGGGETPCGVVERAVGEDLHQDKLEVNQRLAGGVAFDRPRGAAFSARRDDERSLVVLLHLERNGVERPCAGPNLVAFGDFAPSWFGFPGGSGAAAATQVMSKTEM